MLLVDTVKVDHERGICLSDCIKSPKDVLFFLNSQSDEDDKEKAKQKKAPPKANGHASPTKHKVVGGKILRNKTRNAGVEEAFNAIVEHQKELHAQRQRDGIARYSEAGAGANTKEGKTWKRFQSYKGEAGLPKEAERNRVSGFIDLGVSLRAHAVPRSMSTEKMPASSVLSTALLCHSISIQSRMLARMTKETSPFFGSTSKVPGSLRERRKILYVVSLTYQASD